MSIKINGQHPVDAVFDAIQASTEFRFEAKQFVWENTSGAQPSLRDITDYELAELYVRVQNSPGTQIKY